MKISKIIAILSTTALGAFIFHTYAPITLAELCYFVLSNTAIVFLVCVFAFLLIGSGILITEYSKHLELASPIPQATSPTIKTLQIIAISSTTALVAVIFDTYAPITLAELFHFLLYITVMVAFASMIVMFLIMGVMLIKEWIKS